MEKMSSLLMDQVNNKEALFNLKKSLEIKTFILKNSEIIDQGPGILFEYPQKEWPGR